MSTLLQDALAMKSSRQSGLGPLVVAGRSCVPAVEKEDFIAAMGKAVTGVQIVTTDGSHGRFGVTVSALCSVSAEPPLLAVCINDRSPICPAITENRGFCVSLLSKGQAGISDVFAGRSSRRFDFECAEWSKAKSGSPRLVGAVAAFDCALAAELQAGTHRVFFGRIIEATHRDLAPLLYSRGQYGHPVAF
jgi:flavin reductase